MACPHLRFLDTVWFQTMRFPLELLKEEHVHKEDAHMGAALSARSSAAPAAWHIPDWDKSRGLGTPGDEKPLLMAPAQ